MRNNHWIDNHQLGLNELILYFKSPFWWIPSPILIMLRFRALISYEHEVSKRVPDPLMMAIVEELTDAAINDNHKSVANKVIISNKGYKSPSTHAFACHLLYWLSFMSSPDMKNVNFYYGAISTTFNTSVPNICIFWHLNRFLQAYLVLGTPEPL